MADLSDLLQTLVGIIGGAVYPNGMGQLPVNGTCIKMFPGWPVPTQLDADIAAAIAEVSVFPLPAESNTTRNSNSGNRQQSTRQP